MRLRHPSLRAALALLLATSSLVLLAGPSSASHDTQTRPDSYATPTSTTLSVPAPGVLNNDWSYDGTPIRAILIANPSNGSVTLNTDGSFTYVPNAGFIGNDAFVYRADGNVWVGNNATVSIRVDNVPVASGDTGSTAEDTMLTGASVLANDTDADGTPLTAVLVSNPTRGTVTLNANGTYQYSPNANANGTDSFTYRANDGIAQSNTATVSLTITAVNDAPLTVGNTYTTPGGTVLVVPAPGLVGNDTDIEGNPITVYSVNSGPSNGLISVSADGSFRYAPDAGYAGTDSFTYRAWDGSAVGNLATVSITVANTAPTAADDGYLTTEDGVLTVAAPGVLANDADANGTALTAGLVVGPTNGALTLGSDGAVVYTPNANFAGTDSFTYRAGDGTDSSNVATVTITVAPVNDAPVAIADAYVLDEDGSLLETTGVLVNDVDVDGGPLTAAVVSGPANGELELSPDGTFSYTPDEDFTGADSFTYRAHDGMASSNVATVTLTIAPDNDAPVAQDQDVTTAEDTAVSGTFGVSDVDSTVFTFAIEAGPDYGDVVLDTVTGAFTYTPDADESGTDWIVYSVCDDQGVCDTATVTLTVTAVNDAPEAFDGAVTTAEDTAVEGWLDFFDIDSDTFTATVVDAPARGAVVLTEDFGFTYTPTADLNGPDSFTVETCDAEGLCDTATIAVTVSAVNDAPVVTVGGGTDRTGLAGSPVVIDATGTDVDNEVATYAWSQTGGAAVTLTQAGGRVSFTPAAAGTYSFAVTACDVMGLCTTQAVSVVVADGPIALVARALPVAAAAVGAALPSTGTETVRLLGAAAVLVLAGWFMVSGARRRADGIDLI